MVTVQTFDSRHEHEFELSLIHAPGFRIIATEFPVIEVIESLNEHESVPVHKPNSHADVHENEGLHVANLSDPIHGNRW